MENPSPLKAYDRQRHLEWFEDRYPTLPNWPPYPRDEEEAARYIAAYTECVCCCPEFAHYADGGSCVACDCRGYRPAVPGSAAAVNLAPRGRACPLCEAPAGEPCQPKPAADHLARYLDAYTAGQLTRAYMAKVLGELVVIDEYAVIPAGAR